MFNINISILKNKICKLFKNCCNSNQILVNHYRVLLAFTLAEVLITLLVIGIVASLVIPAVIRDTQEAELHTAYKKGLSTFSQSFMRMRMDNGGTLANVFHNGDLVGFKQIFSQYLNITKYSSTSTTTPNATWLDYLTYKRLNGQIETSSSIACSGCPSAQLMDGSFFEVYLDWADNNLSTCNLGGSKPKNGLCFNIVYDVNGKRPPNVIGRDIYILAVYKDKVVPADWSRLNGSIDESSCTPSGTGYGCAIKYAKE